MAGYKIKIETRQDIISTTHVRILPRLSEEDVCTLAQNSSTQRLLPLFQPEAQGASDCYSLNDLELIKRGVRAKSKETIAEIADNISGRIVGVLSDAGVEVDVEYLDNGSI